MQHGSAVGRPVKAGADFDLGLFVAAIGASVVLGNGLLSFAEHIDAEAFFGVQMGMGPSFMIDADQHQQRIEGNRTESVGGHAMNFAVEIDGDDGDSGGETAHSFAEFGRIQRHKRNQAAAGSGTAPSQVPSVRPLHYHGAAMYDACNVGLTSITTAGNPRRAGIDCAAVLAKLRPGEPISREDAVQLIGCADEELPDLLAAARAARERFKPGVITYSRKVFLPLTNLCRDYCGYCTFRRDPGEPGAHTMTPEAVLAVCRSGGKLGCTEALFSLGDKPELLFPEMRETLRQLGYKSTLHYLEAMCELVLRETSLLPHPNPGLLSAEWIARLAVVSPSMGLMLETTNVTLLAPGAAHDNAPDKVPAKRLRTIEDAGKQGVPFTTGILIGIGESAEDRVEALVAIRDLQERYGHIQEVIVQNFRVKPAIPMSHWPEPSRGEMLRAVAVARLLMPRVNIQAPPNLSAPYYEDLLDAGINDWGGVSPLTPDFINPEKPWPQLEQLRLRTEAKGLRLRQRLPVYPEFVSAAINRPGLLSQKLRIAAGDDGLTRRAA